jgi:hypothetical protein
MMLPAALLASRLMGPGISPAGLCACLRDIWLYKTANFSFYITFYISQLQACKKTQGLDDRALCRIGRTT